MGELTFNDVDVVKAIKQSVATGVIEVDGKNYLTRAVHAPPPDPQIDTLMIHSLTGVVAYMTNNVDDLKGAYVQVTAPNCVDVILPPSGRTKERGHALRAGCWEIGLKLNQYLSIEDAVVQLQCCFVASDMRAALLAVLGNVTAEVIGKWGDDGISQTVTAKRGLSLSATVQVPNPVPLAPFRTFPEIDQPESLFVVRLKQTDKAPMVALYEADGGKWRSEATDSIATYLRGCMAEFTVIA